MGCCICRGKALSFKRPYACLYTTMESSKFGQENSLNMFASDQLFLLLLSKYESLLLKYSQNELKKKTDETMPCFY